MKRLRMERFGLDALYLEKDAARPAPGAGKALIEVKAAGLNPSDLVNVNGGFHQTTLPRTPGRDYAGVVAEGPSEWVGAAVWGCGAELGFTADGAHAEYVVVPAASLVRKPEKLSFAAAAAVGVPFTTAWLALVDSARLAEGETLLMIGSSGSVGHAATQIADVRKARALGVDRTNSQNAAEWVRAQTGGRGVDVCLDAVGGPMFPVALESLASGGRLAVIVAKGDGNITFNLRDFYHRRLRLIGVDSLAMGAEAGAAIYRDLTPLFEAGRLTIEEPEQIPLELGVAAYQRLAESGSRKMVLAPASSP